MSFAEDKKTVPVEPAKLDVASYAERLAFGWDAVQAENARLVAFADEMGIDITQQ